MDAVYEDNGHSDVFVRDITPTTLKNTTCESKKRKRESDEYAQPSNWFEAKVLPATTPIDISFSTVSTILRAHLPLSWLCHKTISNHLPPGVILEASIPYVSRWEYQVLIVRHLPNGALYALEKVEESIFVCHPLQAWVTSKWVQQAAIGAAPLVDLDVLLKPTGIQNHSRQVSNSSMSSLQQLPTAPSSPKQPKNRRGILARKSILEKEGLSTTQRVGGDLRAGLDVDIGSLLPTQDHCTADLQPTTQYTASDAVSNPAPEIPITNIPDGATPHSSQAKEPRLELAEVDHLSSEYLRKRYLETLYLCKTTLAFYAKGPLSRTRARIRVPGSSISPEELASYYRDLILPAKKLDLKYKESIKNTTTTISQRISIDLTKQDECTKSAPKPKKPKKPKLGKDALWPMEEGLIEQWWKKRDYKKEAMTSTNGQVAEFRDALAQLRMRETELQIILILEVMALEAKDKSQQMQSVRIDTDVKIESVETTDADLAPGVTKSKKKWDLNSELENLLDRLCIWHTLGADEHNPSSSNALDLGQESSTTMKDRLRDFCKDVIVPFYGGKLPEQCKIVCKKLGGPEISPQRPSLVNTVRTVPGSVITTRRPVATKRTLERVLSEDQGTRHFSPPTFSRSATLPVVPALKREPSERPASRSNRQKSISFSNREIDLVADANITAAKRRKLDIIAAQKRELDAAIEALKKPNRSMLAKDFMNDIESRSIDKKSATKRVEPVQIRATPRHDRVRPDEDDEYDLPPLPFIMLRHNEPVVPSSTTKQRGSEHLLSVSRYSTMKKAVLSAISDTPQRPRLQHSNSAGSENQDYHEAIRTGCQSSSTLVTSTPSMNRRRTDLDNMSAVTPLAKYKLQTTAESTSTRLLQASTTIAFKDIPKIPQAAGRAMERVMMKGANTNSGNDESIYDTLGWNDDSDI